MNKRVISILLCFMLMFSLSACGKTEEDNTGKDEAIKEESINDDNKVKEDKEKIHLAVGYAPGIGNMLCFLAEEKGFFKEENLDVELIAFTNSSDGLNALNADKLDMGISFGTAAPLTFITNGANFTFFGGYLSGGHPIYTNNETAENYKDIEDFKGKIVASPRLYTPDIVWRSAMYEAQIDIEEDLELIEMKKPSDVLEAVKSGKVDIGIGTGSTYSKIREANLPIIEWSNDLWDDHVCCRPVAKTKFINENSETVEAFLRCMIKAERVWQEEPDFAVEVNKKYLKLDEDMAKEITLETNQVIESDPKRKGIIDMWNRMSEIGYLDQKNIDVDDHINIDLYRSALDNLLDENQDDEFYKKLDKRFIEYNLD